MYEGCRLRLDESGVPKGLRLLGGRRADCGRRFSLEPPALRTGGGCAVRVRDDLVGWVSRWLGGVKDWLRRTPLLEAVELPGMSSVGGVGVVRGRGPFCLAAASRSTPTYMVVLSLALLLGGKALSGGKVSG